VIWKPPELGGPGPLGVVAPKEKKIIIIQILLKTPAGSHKTFNT